MKSKFYSFKSKAIKLRGKGKTYGEIRNILKIPVPKSTLSTWFTGISFTNEEKKKITEAAKNNFSKGLKIALLANKQKREKYLKSIIERNKNLSNALKNKNICKIALSVLYLGEGQKGIDRGSLRLGNSDPFVISMFLNLMRKCYNINERKFRCTVQCRADQNTKDLEIFWSQVTGIPLTQFYKARIDARTIGKPSKKLDYKGVCAIDYFSADIFLDLMQIPRIIYKMGL